MHSTHLTLIRLQAPVLRRLQRLQRRNPTISLQRSRQFLYFAGLPYDLAPPQDSTLWLWRAIPLLSCRVSLEWASTHWASTDWASTDWSNILRRTSFGWYQAQVSATSNAADRPIDRAKRGVWKRVSRRRTTQDKRDREAFINSS
jgi:hypothetical protein